MTVTIQSYFLAVSNLFFLVPSVRAFLLNDWLRGILLALTTFFSFTYHLCDPYIYSDAGVCIFSVSTHHNLDFFFSQLLIPATILLFIYFPSKLLEYIVLTAFGVFIGFTLHVDNILYIIIAIASGLLLMYWIVYSAINKKIVQYRWTNVVLGLILVSIAVLLFVIDMLPNNSYFIEHSLWHILIAYGIFILLIVRI